MDNNIIDIFKEITAIPRCSGTHEAFINYMKNLSKELGYLCLVDEYNNILCKKENSNAKLVFQSHYDIVCLSDNCVPNIVQDGDLLKATDSTLGSDNGIGCSYMIALMCEKYDGEFLFTSDEEIGLIGANNLSLPLNASYMLNLDSEEEGEICIGCAGGVDIFGINSNKKIIPNTDNLDLYEITISKLQGGHSGVDIDKNIPNGIKLIAKTIKECDGKLLDINGGERINSIPVNVKAIIASKSTPIASHEFMEIEKIDTKSEHLNVYDDKIIDFIYDFQNGVRAMNDELKVVQNSINLAIIKTGINEIKIELSARSMDNTELKNLKDETIKMLEDYNFIVETNGKYPAWKPDINEFTSKVLEIYKEVNPKASLEAIHAGLECAIFKDKYPHIKVASIGPTINFPHSKKEQVSIKSVENVYKIVKKITQEMK
ncbi:M20/M25/M40 family metallo-hydrolase [Arcobacter sp. L]|uniref:M20/M25/M40 family metallo-hydrolase n=1 Tax=Arcobacter sp. L TaxID=944547 RepID=UPI000229612A|nr:M20/M25/M40 family metallo-hydrolase [Arcobacter sp. L]BAK73509.1 aminoacyl-histidine dipeptidase PepD [Arcobacter sp. L]